MEVTGADDQAELRVGAFGHHRVTLDDLALAERYVHCHAGDEEDRVCELRHGGRIRLRHQVDLCVRHNCLVPLHDGWADRGVVAAVRE